MKTEETKDVVKDETTIENENSKSYISLDFARTADNISDTSLFHTIAKTIAIIIYPDSAWMSEQLNQMGEDNWNEVVADREYYNYEAMKLIEDKGIEVKFYSQNKPYFKFILKDKNEYLIDKSKMKDKWGLILFNDGMNPVFWGGAIFDDAMKDIYEK